MNISLQRFLRHLYFLCQKELLSLFKDPRMRIQLVMPVIIEGFLFGYAANYNIEEVPYAVVDNSGTASSRDFLAHIEAAPTFSCTAVCGNVQEVSELIDAGEILGAVVIPEDFEKKRLPGGPAPGPGGDIPGASRGGPSDSGDSAADGVPRCACAQGK